MTAVNLWTTPKAACLLTDQACLSGNKLAIVWSKVVSDQRLQMAIARNGNVTVLTRSIIYDWFESKRDQAHAMGEIGQLLDLIRADAEKNGGHEEPSPANLFIALWLADVNKPEAYYFDGNLQAVSHAEAPPSNTLLPTDLKRPWLIKRIEDQRRNGRHPCNIGAAAELTVVTATGITSEIIHRWPDRLGEPITP